MSFLFKPKSQPQQQQAPSYTSLPTQTSSYGKAIPVVFGQARIAPNLLWYDDFKAIPHTTTTDVGGGKGASGTQTSTTYTYQTGLIFGLGEGPISGVAGGWAGKQTATVAGNFLTLKYGTLVQPVWTYLTSNHPDKAFPYNGIAYLATGSLDLQDSPNLENWNWEVQGIGYGGAANLKDAIPAYVVQQVLTSDQYGIGFPSDMTGTVVTVTQTVTIPSSAPYQVTPTFAALMFKPLDVVYTSDGTTLVQSSTTGTQITGQYNVGPTGVYTFAAGDATKSVTITYAYHDPVWRDHISFTQASGLWISPAYTESSPANQLLADIATYTHSEFVWSQGVLHLISRGGVSLSANGANYTAPSAPLFDLTDEDFLENHTSPPGSVSGSSNDPVILGQVRASDQDNVIKVEYLDRSNAYAAAIAEVTDDADIAIEGRKRFSGSKQAHMFCDGQAAHTAAQLLLQQQYIRNFYAFTLDKRWIILDPMDIVTITDSNLGLSRQWVRITELTENDDGTINVVAEEYLDGTGAAALFNINTSTGYIPDYNASAGSINTPIIFEAPVELAPTGLEIWAALSGSNPLWGGADVYVSSDQVTYSYIGRAAVAARMGQLTSSLGKASDPDLNSVISVDLSMSRGTLASGSQTDADLGNTLCIVDNEIITYETAILTGPYQYNLESYLRRGFAGTTIAQHSAGAPFARLDDTGIIQVPYNSGQIGETVYLKFTSFNIYGGGQENLADVPAYQHTIVGPPPPGAIQDFQVSQTAGYPVVFKWTDLIDNALKGYDILYGPVGGTVDTAFLLLETLRSTSETNGEVGAGVWIFFIRGHSITGQIGPATSVQFTVQNPNGNVISQSSGPDWIDSTNGTQSTMSQVVLTSGNSWTVPAGATNIKVECIGAGGAGSLGTNGVVGSGGGGGAYAAKNSIPVQPGAQVNYQIGTDGFPTWFISVNTVLADSGRDASAGGTGGTATKSVGDVKFSGGNGAVAAGGAGGGGGGAAGPNGAGANASGASGGQGDNGHGGAGGVGALANLVTSPNKFDTGWEQVNCTVGAGLGPVTLTFPGGSASYLTTQGQFALVSGTTYTISATVKGNIGFRFGGNDGASPTPTAFFSPNMSANGRVIWTTTVGTIGPGGGNFSISTDTNNTGGTLTISDLWVQVGPGSTFTTAGTNFYGNAGAPGTEYSSTVGCGGGGGAGGYGGVGGASGGGAGGGAEIGTITFDPAVYDGNILPASNTLLDPVWKTYSTGTLPTIVSANGTTQRTAPFVVTFPALSSGVKQILTSLRPNTQYNISAVIGASGTVTTTPTLPANNIVTQEDISQTANWTNTNVTVSPISGLYNTLTWTAGTRGAASYNWIGTSGAQYTVQVWAQTTSGTAQFNFNVWDGGSVDNYSQTFTVTNSAQLFSFNFTAPLMSGFAGIALVNQVNGTFPGGTIQFADFALVQTSAPAQGGGGGFNQFIGAQPDTPGTNSLANLCNRPMDVACDDGQVTADAGARWGVNESLGYGVVMIDGRQSYTNASTAASGGYNSVYANAAQIINGRGKIPWCRIGIESNGNWLGFWIWQITPMGTSNHRNAYMNFARQFRTYAPSVLIGMNHNLGMPISQADAVAPTDDLQDFVSTDTYDNGGFFGSGSALWNNWLTNGTGLNWMDAYSRSGYTSANLAAPRTKNLFIAVPEWGVGQDSGDAAGAYVVQQFLAWVAARNSYFISWQYWNSTSDYNGSLNNYPQAAQVFKQTLTGTKYAGSWSATPAGLCPASIGN